MLWQKLIVICCIVVTVSGCAYTTNQMILNPVYKHGQISTINSSINTSVIDLRPDMSTVKLVKSNQTKTLASPGVSQLVKGILDSALSQNGARITNLATVRFEVDIHHLQAYVIEKMLNHTSVASIEFGVRIIAPTRNFSKVYQGTANLAGPFGHDKAKVESQLNKLTEQLITRIVSDPELIAFLEG